MFCLRRSFSVRNTSHLTIPTVCKHTVSVTRTISIEDVKKFADLSGDRNPIHLSGEDSIVHGTFLLACVSSIMGTKLPGPGSIVSTLNVQFLNPCKVNSEVEISVSCEEIRKITTVTFMIENVTSNNLIAKGDAKLLKKN